MKPYYEEPSGTLYNMDCLELMKTMGDKSVDLILADPPYGIGESYASYEDNQENLKKLVDSFMPELLRISDTVLITCGVGNIHLYPKPKWIMAWFVPAGAGSGPWGFCCWQPILCYGTDPYLKNGLGRRPDAFEQTEATKGALEKSHPCAKPIDVWRKILLRGSTKEGDTIFDPFLGSGTTARACKDLGRKWIGCELEEKYCQVAVKRLSQSVMDFNTP